MSAEQELTKFLVNNYAIYGIEVRGTGPGLVTCALPHQVEDADLFIGEVSSKFAASVDLRVTEQGVELDFYPQSLQASEPQKNWRCCVCAAWIFLLILCISCSVLAILYSTRPH